MQCLEMGKMVQKLTEFINRKFKMMTSCRLLGMGPRDFFASRCSTFASRILELYVKQKAACKLHE